MESVFHVPWLGYSTRVMDVRDVPRGRYYLLCADTFVLHERLLTQVDMPLKWRGKEGVFTKDFEMNEPGKSTITVNNYRNLGLRTCKTYSKVHRDLDMDF